MKNEGLKGPLQGIKAQGRRRRPQAGMNAKDKSRLADGWRTALEPIPVGRRGRGHQDLRGLRDLEGLIPSSQSETALDTRREGKPTFRLQQTQLAGTRDRFGTALGL
jgi:hypothetical protein